MGERHIPTSLECMALFEMHVYNNFKLIYRIIFYDPLSGLPVGSLSRVILLFPRCECQLAIDLYKTDRQITIELVTIKHRVFCLRSIPDKNLLVF